MKWKRVIGQSHAKDILIASIRSQHIAHAYCFWGPEGVGKDALALEFARVLNCQEPIETADSIEACDHCRSCLQMNTLQHPNLQLIFSLPATNRVGSNSDESPLLRLSDDQISLIQEQLILKAHNPYHNITIPNATQIRIASIRDVRRSLQLAAPVHHGWRVVIISEADAMTTEAANAFLKTLEEPHQRTTLILTSSRRDLLPETIRSRCQHIHCGTLSEDDIASALIERESLAPDRARIIAALAHGSYARALELANSTEDEDALAEIVLNFLRTLLKPSRYRNELAKLIEQRFAAVDRQHLRVYLRMLEAWLHDANRLVMIGDRANDYLVFQHGAASSAIRRFIAHYPHARLDKAICAIEDAIEAIESNAQIPLTLLTLAVRLRRAIGSTPTKT
ncbi:MAG: DNA polymerase III subunit delta' [Candidatus Kapaibacterium sp.]|nr:MAG: DNA polymerase III subunit delta' [Candidatus Kapabacteria bacterium]